MTKKVEILKSKSSIKINQNISQYLTGDEFDFSRRKENLINLLFDEIFNFDKGIFNITIDEVKKYNTIEEIIAKNSDEKMLELLKEHGSKFEIKLQRDPDYKDIYDRWLTYHR